MDHLISPSPVCKLLGIHLDNNLNWGTHVSTVISKMKSGMHMINNLKNTVPIYTLKDIYYAHVNSHLVYGLHIWGPMLSQKDLKRLFVEQKKCVRSIVKARYNAHTDPIFSKLKILKTAELIDLNQILFMFDIKNQNVSSRIRNLFSFSTKKYVTRNAQVPIVIKHRTKAMNSSVFVKSIKLWSSLGSEVNKLRSKYSVKQMFKTKDL